jgi:hypothetical protein
MAWLDTPQECFPEGNKDASEVALGGLIGHTMRAADEGAPGLGEERFVLVRYHIKYQ